VEQILVAGNSETDENADGRKILILPSPRFVFWVGWFSQCLRVSVADWFCLSPKVEVLVRGWVNSGGK
jgi:hypothetical protein